MTSHVGGDVSETLLGIGMRECFKKFCISAVLTSLRFVAESRPIADVGVF